MNGSAGSNVMTSKKRDAATERRRSESKIDPAPNSNTEKEPDDWIPGDDPMTTQSCPAEAEGGLFGPPFSFVGCAASLSHCVAIDSTAL
jgi:hypothetical protein